MRSDKNPKVSIIIPVKNGADTIGDLLDSLMKLDYDPNYMEIIVVDGKSIDGTREIAARYPVHIISEEGKGLNAARNTGIKYSRGEVVAFIDADCVASRRWLKELVKNFSDSRIGCVGGSVKGYNNDFFSNYADHSMIRVMPSFKTRLVLDGLRPFRYPAGCNMAFRKEAVLKAGYFDEEIRYGFDDLEFIERIGRAGYNIALDPDVLVLHKHRRSLTELLRQTFQYGRGGGIVLKRKGLSTPLARWLFLCIVIFFSALTIVSGLITLYLWLKHPLLYYTLIALVVVPLFMSMTYYAIRGPKKGKILAIITYPFIDFLRCLAFCVGEIYQLIKSE